MSEQLYADCQKFAGYWGRQMGQSEETIEDAAAEAYLRCHDKGEVSQSYIVKAVKCCLIDFIRSPHGRTRPMVSEPTKPLINHKPSSAYFDEVETAIIKKYLIDRLEGLQQDVMVVHLAGCDQNEACTLLDMSVGSYKGYLRRARVNLKRLLVRYRKKTRPGRHNIV